MPVLLRRLDESKRARSGRSQYSPLIDGKTRITMSHPHTRLPKVFWATQGKTGWQVHWNEPGNEVNIPTHNRTLLKWAREQKNLDLLDEAKRIELARDKPRPSVLKALNEALTKWDA